MTPEEAVKAVLAAERPEDLFGPDADGARAEYRRLARLLHPDVAGAEDTRWAFERLTYLREWYRTGDEPAGGPSHLVIDTRKRSYVVGDIAYHGTIANVYRAVYDDHGDRAEAFLKMPRRPADSDLIAAEATNLKTLNGDADYANYFPTLIESFRHQDRKTNARRRVNVFRPIEQGFVTLRTVLDAYPNGLDPRDLAWIWRRLLVACGVAHDHGIVHGAPTADHVLVHPIDHGVVLIDWCHSVPVGQPLRAVPLPRNVIYDDPTLTKAATGALDLAIVADTARQAMDWTARYAGMYATFLKGLRSGPPKHWPDAAETLKLLDDLLARLYGPRRYRPLHLPTTVA